MECKFVIPLFESQKSRLDVFLKSLKAVGSYYQSDDQLTIIWKSYDDNPKLVRNLETECTYQQQLKCIHDILHQDKELRRHGFTFHKLSKIICFGDNVFLNVHFDNVGEINKQAADISSLLRSSYFSKEYTALNTKIGRFLRIKIFI